MEVEARARAELMRIKKKLESDLNDMELSLEHATKANSDIQKVLHTTQDHARDVQMHLEDEIRLKKEVMMSMYIRLQ